MSRFIESIRVENRKIYLANLHQQRVDRTFRHFCKCNAINISKIFEAMTIPDHRLYKLRIVYDLEGNFDLTLVRYESSQLIDFELINANINYAFKYENRGELDALKSSSNCSEIIIVKNGMITDTSFSNLVFLKDKIWYTPKSFLLNGIQRQNLLHSGRIKEAEISLENLRDYSHFQVINAMNGMDDRDPFPISAIRNLA